MQCKKTVLKHRTQEQRRPTPSCPDATHHYWPAARLSADLLEAMAVLEVAEAHYADSRGDSNDGLEVGDHRHIHHSRSHLQGLVNHHRDGHNRQAEDSEHAGRCLRCFAPSCLPSCPSVPSSLLSPAVCASPQVVVAPSCLSSRTAGSRPQEDAQRCLRIRRIRRSRVD